MAQLDLFGKKKSRFKFGRMFPKHVKKAEPSGDRGVSAGTVRARRRGDSGAEDKIAAILSGRGISFHSHKPIASSRDRRRFAFSAEEKLDIVGSCGLDPERLALVLKRADLGKIHPELFRCDFLVEGVGGRTYIEYFGLFNPKVRIDAKTMRKRHYRQIAVYTFVKAPLKLALYKRVGAKTIFIYPGDDFAKKLAELGSPDQERTTLSSLTA